MDPKFDISKQNTIKTKVQLQLVRMPEELALRDIALVFAHVFQLETAILKSEPYSTSIYTFAYLFDRNLTKKSQLFTALIESIHGFGTHVFELTKLSGSIKEDDINLSGFSFSKHVKSHDEICELLLQAQKKFEAEYKKGMNLHLLQTKIKIALILF